MDGEFSTEWFHIAVNYINPNDAEELRVYKDGADETGDAKVESGYSHPIADGRIVVGRFWTDSDNGGTAYSSVWVDELFVP